MMRKFVGNYEMNLEVSGAGHLVKVFFSANEDLSKRAYLEITSNGFNVVREIADRRWVCKEYPGVGTPPWKIKVLKKGNFFRFWVNQVTGWMHSPLGAWTHPTDNFESWEAYAGVEVPDGGEVTSFTVTTLPWLSQITKPVIPAGPEGSFFEQQAIPGGLIRYQGTYYMYFMAGMRGDEEGASRRAIGVASSPDLIAWTVHPEPVITYGDSGSWEPTGIYPSGAVVTPEGQVAVMYAAQKFPNWNGFGLAIAEHPLGPFQKYPGNPVYQHNGPAHEFDLVHVDSPDYRYLLFYAGFTTNPPGGPAGDRGYLLYSDDLLNWKADERNPVFGPETRDNWDAIHVRPRGLNRVGDMWYLWYEGANHWIPKTKTFDGQVHHGWWDTVGLARSTDLIHWEYYPRNPALPGLGMGAEQFDNTWVGWPRMFIKDGIGYVFYTGGGAQPSVGLRTIEIDRLTQWEGEGGETIDMLIGGEP